MIVITSAQLKAFSAVFSNLVVLWIAAIPGSIGDWRILTVNIMFAIICWKLTILAEEKLEEIT